MFTKKINNVSIWKFCRQTQYDNGGNYMLKKKAILISALSLAIIGFSLPASASNKQFISNESFVTKAKKLIEIAKQDTAHFKIDFDNGDGNFSFTVFGDNDKKQTLAKLNQFSAQSTQTTTINGSAAAAAYTANDIVSTFTDNITLNNNGVLNNDIGYWTGQSSAQYQGSGHAPLRITLSDNFSYSYVGSTISLSIPAGGLINAGTSSSTVTWPTSTNGYAKIASYTNVRGEAYDIVNMGHNSTASFDFSTLYSVSVGSSSFTHF